MNIVVIGGTTFIGPRVLARFGQHRVTVFHRGTSCSDVRHIHDDRANLAKHALRADVVIDMIAMTQRDAETLVAAKIAPRLVVISSGDVYRQYDLVCRRALGESDPLPLREDAPLRATRFPHGDDYEKILVEDIVRRELGATVLRLCAVYGVGDPRKRFDPWRTRAVTLPQDYARWRWTRAYVDNVADAIVLAATDARAAGRVYNVGEADAPPEREWAARFATRVDVTRERDVMRGYDWRYDLILDTRAIREELGYRERVSRDEAVRITIAS